GSAGPVPGPTRGRLAGKSVARGGAGSGGRGHPQSLEPGGTDVTWVLLPAVTAFVISLLLGPATIGYLRRLRLGQEVREDGPQSHRKKAGTPTMGGVLIVFAAAAAALAFSPSFEQLPYALATMVGFGLIGLVDDALKVVARRSLGLKARQKLAGQALFAALLALFALTHVDLGPWVRVPFSAETLFLPPWLYVLLTMGAVMGS